MVGDAGLPVAGVTQEAPPLRVGFVGRERELRALVQRLNAAIDGTAGVALIGGDAGIGKTRLAEELATRALGYGAHVLWGRCHEDLGAPAFWPWAQALRTYIAEREPHELQAELASGAAEIAQIVPELHERLPGIRAVQRAAEPELSRFRLFDAIMTFLRRAAAARPLMITLDDLHWADAGSLHLLHVLAHEIGAARLLVVATYRDTEVEVGHPFAQSLVELARTGRVEQLSLRGMDATELARFISLTAGYASPKLVATVARRSEGNPFFAGEIVRLLAADGRLEDDPEGAPAPLPLPLTVRETIHRRLRRLSPSAGALLTLAAVAGRHFDHRLLAAASSDELDGAEVLRLLEGAVSGRVLEADGPAGAFRFAHTLIQETLLAELPFGRRASLHGTVAEALERLAGDHPDRLAAALAQHYAESAALLPVHAVKALRYSRVAAQQAEAATGWEEAARQYERCLVLLAAGAADTDADEAALLLAQGRCLRYAAEWRLAWRSLMRAIALFRARGDGEGVARATLETQTMIVQPTRLARLIDEALVDLGEGAPHLRAWLLVRRAQAAKDDTGRRAEALAAELAREHGFADVSAFLKRREAQRVCDEGQFAAARSLYLAAFEVLADLGRHFDASEALSHGRQLPLAMGFLDEGEREVLICVEYAHRVHLRDHEDHMWMFLAALALARCQFDRFEMLAGRLVADPYWLTILRATRSEVTGDLEQALAMLPVPEDAGPIPRFAAHVLGARARIRLSAGDEAGARRELYRWADAFAQDLNPYADNMSQVFGTEIAIAEVDECLPTLGSEVLVQTMYQRLGRWPQLRYNTFSGRSMDRLRGALALRLDLRAEAEAHLRAAIAWAEREGCPIELGRSLHGLADVLTADEHPEATLPLLDRAIAIFTQYGARLYHKRADDARRALIATPSRHKRAAPYSDGLTARQVEYLCLLAAGRTNREIAQTLVVSENAVEQMLVKLYDRVGARNRAEAIRYAITNGIVAN